MPKPSRKSSSVPRKKQTYRYLLGDAAREARRLKDQAKLWDPIAHEVFQRLGVRRGWKVLEIGPGRGSLHMDLRKRVKGPVDFVERSPSFADHLRRLIQKDRLGQAQGWVQDLIEADLPKAHYDLIFARWVFLFLPDPEAHVKKLVAALKPGGHLVIQDYCRETLAMIPTHVTWRAFMAADLAFFASQGGDASIGIRLPALFRKSKLKLLSIEPTIKTGKPGSPTWKWIQTFFFGVLDRYAEFPPFDRQQAKALRAHWVKMSSEPTSFVIAPTVVTVVGEKLRKR